MPTIEKLQQETNSLRRIKDGFPKIIIVGGLTPSYINEEGIIIMNVVEFLTNPDSLSV